MILRYYLAWGSGIRVMISMNSLNPLYLMGSFLKGETLCLDKITIEASELPRPQGGASESRKNI
jgi:hypothetical protein